jgi:hypothetical protein
MVKKVFGIILCFLLAGCNLQNKKVVKGPTPGIEYHNQTTAPWPWVSIVPSERALALKEVNFESITKHLHFDMSFEPHQKTFQDVRVLLLDYTILPEEIPTKENKHIKPEVYRPKRYFMVASFYKIGRRPPCPPDFEVTTSLQVNRAAPQEAMRYMARDIIEEIAVLDEDGLLTPGKKITVNLD